MTSVRATSFVLLSVAGVAGGVGAGIAAWSPSDHILLISLVAIVLTSPILIRIGQGRFDLLEPIVWINGALAVMFVVRPAAILWYDTPVYRRRFDAVTTHFDEATIVALFGIAAMQAAYFSGLGRRLAALVPLPARQYRRESLVAGASVLIAVGIALYSIFALSAGVSPVTLIAGGIPAGQFETTAYLYLAPFMLVPAALILFKVGVTERRAAFAVGSVLAMIALVNSLAPSGQRLWLLVILSSLAVYPMLRTGWRPNVTTVLIVLAAGFVVVVSLRDLPQGGSVGELRSSVTRTVEDPGGSVEELLTGPDTEMHNALAVLLDFVPEEYGFAPGHALSSLLAHPIPRLVWPGKPYPMESIVNPDLHRVQAGEASVAYSILGGFYYDGGFVGVIVGMFTLGVLWRALFEWRRRAEGHDMAYVIYALALPFTVVLLRGNLPDTAARALFIVGPAILVAYLASSARAPLRARAPGQLVKG